MKTLTLALVLATLLVVAACSQKKETAAEPTATPNKEEVKSRMEAQQNAIKNASDQLQLRQATPTPTSSPATP